MLFKKLDTNELILANDDLAKEYLKDRNYRVARDSDIEPKDDADSKEFLEKKLKEYQSELKSLETNPPKDKAFAFARTRLLKADISIIKEKLSKFKNDSELATTNDASSEDKQRKQKLEKQLQHFKNQLKEIQSNPNLSAVSFFSYSRTLKNEISELEEKIRSIK